MLKKLQKLRNPYHPSFLPRIGSLRFTIKELIELETTTAVFKSCHVQAIKKTGGNGSTSTLKYLNSHPLPSIVISRVGE